MNSGKEPFEGDELVTETYRELGVEKAPEHLNQSILRMASGGDLRSPARNMLFAAWMKPVAWAATIGLSLAIVLELSEVPTAPVPFDRVPTAESIQEKALEETLAKDADATKKVDNRARTEAAQNRQQVSDEELGRSAAAHDDVEVFSRESKGKLDVLAAPSSQPPPAKAETPAAKERGADLLTLRELAADSPEAKKLAAERPANSQSMASFSLSAEPSDTGDLCNAAARLAEESWLACIEDLRQSGGEEAADREYEAFILKYPVESRNLEGNK